MSADSTGSPAWRVCLGVVLLALLVRLFLCAQFVCISRDGVQFVTYAKQLADDPIPTLRTTTKQPGYAYLLLGTHRLLGDAFGGDTPLAWQRSGQLLAALGGVAACGLLFVLTRRLFDDTSAAVAAILAAFWWQGAQLSADVLSDMPHLAAYLVAFLVGHAALRSGRLRYFAVCGLILGVAYLLRQEAIGLLAAIGLCSLWSGRGGGDVAAGDAWARTESGVFPVLRRPPATGEAGWGSDATVDPPLRMRGLRQRLAVLAVLVACFAVVVAPYAVAVGRIMPNKNLNDLLRGWPGTAAAGGGSGFLLAGIMPWWATPLGMLEGWAKSGRYAYAVLALFGFLVRGSPRAETVGRRLVIAAILMQLLLVQLRVGVYGEISGRYMVLPLALSIPWAASGLVALLNMILAPLEPRRGTLKGIVLTLGILLPLVPQVYYHLRPIKGLPPVFAEAGDWLRTNTRLEDRVLAHQGLEQLMFYADRTYPHDSTWVRFPETASPDETATAMARSCPAWFVDAESARRSFGEDATYVESLRQSGGLELEPVWHTGRPGERTSIMQVGVGEAKQ